MKTISNPKPLGRFPMPVLAVGVDLAVGAADETAVAAFRVAYGPSGVRITDVVSSLPPGVLAVAGRGNQRLFIRRSEAPASRHMTAPKRLPNKGGFIAAGGEPTPNPSRPPFPGQHTHAKAIHPEPEARV